MLESLDDKNNGTEIDGEPSDSEKLANLSDLVSPKSLQNEDNKSNQSE